MNLLRRLPAKDVPKNLVAITNLIEDLDLRDDVQVKTDKPIGMSNTQFHLISYFLFFYFNRGRP